MNGTPHLMWPTSDRVRRSFLCVVFGACVLGYANTALAQFSTGLIGGGGYGGGGGGGAGVGEPPLTPPVTAPLPTGQGMLSIGPFLLTPSLDTSTFYNSNIYSSTKNPLAAPGFEIRPSLLADWNTGIHDIKLYGNIDSDIYPTLPSINDTFNRQAGAINSYSPLPGLIFTGQFNYSHSSLANVIPGSALPSPIISPANPALPGAAGIVAAQQVVVNPNDMYTASFDASKQFNRAYLDVGGTFVRQVYSNTPAQDYDQGAYYASSGAWLTPLLYAYAQAIDSNSVNTNIPPAGIGSIANSYLARAGIGSAQIGLFRGSAYYGHQGTAVDGDGKAGGDIYGGVLTFLPTPQWNMSVTIDRVRNLSDIAAATNFALSGLAFSAVGLATSDSVQTTSIAYQTNYTLSDQTTLYASASDVHTSFFNMPIVQNSWLLAAGVNYQVQHNLSLSLRYSYTRFLSTQPNSNFTQNLITLSTHYDF